jgi:hypothetical protein
VLPCSIVDGKLRFLKFIHLKISYHEIINQSFIVGFGAELLVFISCQKETQTKQPQSEKLLQLLIMAVAIYNKQKHFLLR